MSVNKDLADHLVALHARAGKNNRSLMRMDCFWLKRQRADNEKESAADEICRTLFAVLELGLILRFRLHEEFL